MIEYLKKFERFIITGLIIMMVIVVFLATIELGWIIIQDIISQPVLLLEVSELMEIFGFFLLVLIGIELLETIKAYLIDGLVHVEIVLEVALIAIARKVIILDIAQYDGFRLLSLAALLVTVSIGFFMVKRFTCAIPSAKE
jgi:uncharacterized membrane protein (DUF373 family)